MEVLEQKKATLSLLVENNSGVLARIASLFERRGYNIETIAASTTESPRFSRITITTFGTAPIIEQIVKQTQKLPEILTVELLEEADSIQRELLLLKIAVGGQERSIVRDVAEVYKASIVDLSSRSMVLELTGKSSKIDAFLRVMEDFTVLELCRTGVTAMAHGDGMLRGGV